MNTDWLSGKSLRLALSSAAFSNIKIIEIILIQIKYNYQSSEIYMDRITFLEKYSHVSSSTPRPCMVLQFLIREFFFIFLGTIRSLTQDLTPTLKKMST